MARLENKTALITAAGQGIGRATTLAFAREGARVLATDINEELLHDFMEETSAIKIQQLDVTDDQAVEDIARHTGAVDVLFNCAGYVHNGTILDCTNDVWDFAFQLNVRSMYQLVSAYLPLMIDAGGASIINMSSVVSSVKAAPNRFVYGATKAAVIGLTKSIAIDYVRAGIRCNAICPGTIHTPSLDERISVQEDAGKARAAFIARQPMARLGTSEEIAELAVYLASDESSFTTGTTHIIDGGFSM